MRWLEDNASAADDMKLKYKLVRLMITQLLQILVYEFQIKNINCSTRLRILITSLGPRKPRCKFKSSAAPLAIKSDNYARAVANLLSVSYR